MRAIPFAVTLLLLFLGAQRLAPVHNAPLAGQQLLALICAADGKCAPG